MNWQDSLSARQDRAIPSFRPAHAERNPVDRCRDRLGSPIRRSRRADHREQARDDPQLGRAARQDFGQLELGGKLRLWPVQAGPMAAQRNQRSASGFRVSTPSSAPTRHPRCVDADARAAGCIAVDLFGEGAITPEAANWIRADLHQESDDPPIYGPGVCDRGSVSTARRSRRRGVSLSTYRQRQPVTHGRHLSQTGGTTGNAVPNFGGSISAMGRFWRGECSAAPDVPGAYSLSFDASARARIMHRPRRRSLQLAWRRAICAHPGHSFSRPVRPRAARARHRRALFAAAR